MAQQKIGSIGWIDLTVEDADEVRDFYADVVGWKPDPVEMSGYSDYNMSPPGGSPVAGVCHARGGNADMPPVWLLYVVVANLDDSIERCTARGGSIIAGPKKMGASRYCVISDPAGAQVALYQP